MYRSHRGRAARGVGSSLWSRPSGQPGLAAPERAVGPALAQGNGDKLMLEKTVPEASGEEPLL